jgi:hypothetical protein
MNTGAAEGDDDESFPLQLARTRDVAITTASPVKLNMLLAFMLITSFLLSPAVLYS